MGSLKVICSYPLFSDQKSGSRKKPVFWGSIVSKKCHFCVMILTSFFSLRNNLCLQLPLLFCSESLFYLNAKNIRRAFRCFFNFFLRKLKTSGAFLVFMWILAFYPCDCGGVGQIRNSNYLNSKLHSDAITKFTLFFCVLFGQLALRRFCFWLYSFHFCTVLYRSVPGFLNSY